MNYLVDTITQAWYYIPFEYIAVGIVVGESAKLINDHFDITGKVKSVANSLIESVIEPYTRSIIDRRVKEIAHSGSKDDETDAKEIAAFLADITTDHAYITSLVDQVTEGLNGFKTVPGQKYAIFTEETPSKVKDELISLLNSKMKEGHQLTDYRISANGILGENKLVAVFSGGKIINLTNKNLTSTSYSYSVHRPQIVNWK